MSYAVVELKYVKKKTFIVPIYWIKNYKANQSSTQDYYCYISTDLKDGPNFESKYLVKFNGTSGLFKVFILTVTDSLLDAVSYQEQKRVKSIPQKFRQPSNTDAEINAERTKRRKKNNVITKAAKETAKTKNIAHLASVFKNVTSPSTIKSSALNDVDITASTNGYTGMQQGDDQKNGMETLPIESPSVMSTESPSVMSTDFASVVREALETLENDDVFDNYNFTGGLFQLDEYIHVEASNTKGIHTDDNSQAISIENCGTSDSIHQLHFHGSVTQALTPTPFTSTSSTINIIPERIADTIATRIEVPTLLHDTPNLPKCNNIRQTTHHAISTLTEAETVTPHTSTSAIDNTIPIHTDSAIFPVIEAPNDVAYPSPSPSTYKNFPQPTGNSTVIEASTPTSTTSNRMIQSVDELIRAPSGTNLPQQVCNDKQNQENVISDEGIDYKDAYLQLKKRNAELEERNNSLQKALVAADKALANSKVAEVPFTKQNGGRYYSEGVFLNETQCQILDGTLDHNKYVNNLALAIFGRDTLKNSSVTGTASKKVETPAKPPLNPLWLQLLYDLTDARTNKSLSKSDINVLLNKKISNFNGADKRKSEKVARDARNKLVSKANDVRNGLSG